MLRRMKNKICRGCGVEKNLDTDFYVHSRMADGHLNICKDCVRQRVGIYREANIEAIRAYDRERGRTEEHRERVREFSKKYREDGRHAEVTRRYRERNPEKYKAQTIANNALRDGKLERKPCERCGAKKVHMHHPDYSKPLEVIWLCTRCHEKEHHGR